MKIILFLTRIKREGVKGGWFSRTMKIREPEISAEGKDL
jgi:hypothetical protein